ncbi:MAG TPA: cation-translocating P-type ATPase, partial [Methylococcaceae bacterium]|nr:cation-translocating P-type ATPase [Methylococcaceae bacterium]
TWHDQPLESLAAILETDPNQGLTPKEARRRLERDGRNELRKGKGVSWLAILLGQFNSLVIGVLMVAAALSVVLGEKVDGIAILAIVVLNALIGFAQEYRAEKAAAALARLTAPKARVLRGGHAVQIAAAEVVAGDVLLLEAGDRAAADARIVDSAALRANEASLTGESQPVDKAAGVLPAATPLAERSNMTFLGTGIVGGSARALATATGMDTELGCIARLLETAQSGETPLQRRLDQVARRLLWACLGIVAVVFVLGLLRSVAPFELFLGAISLAVAAIPEGLPAVVTVALALGVQRMIRRNVLVRRLPAVETLGCAEVICTDKTGTLTVGEMTARRLLAGGRLYKVTGEGYAAQGAFLFESAETAPSQEPDLYALLYAAAACNDAEIVDRSMEKPAANPPCPPLRKGGLEASRHLLSEKDSGSSLPPWEKGGRGNFSVVGDPTEGALLVAAAKGGIARADIEAAAPRLAVLPFDSDRRRMTVVRRHPDGNCAFVKGAPETILERCAHFRSGGVTRPLSEAEKATIALAAEWMAHDALRVLAVAQRPLADNAVELPAIGSLPTGGGQGEGELNGEEIERDLIFLGLFGLQDPPRGEAKEAVARCRKAGIRTVMITGDHPDTARAIARELGILQSGDAVVAGAELARMTDVELARDATRIAVYARVTAEDKLRIVRAWKTRDAVVAMTGDGVNDAPALKEASIGIAMGRTGTEVTREAADLIVTDDNFASIVAAVEEGRGIYDNIAKTLAYLLGGNAAELAVMLVAAVLGWPLPLLPLHLLWINLVTDGLPALALATDPIDPGVLDRPPRPPQAQLLDREFIRLTALTGCLTAAVALGAFAWEFYWGGGVEQARDAAFTALVIAELLRAFGARSNSRTVFELGLFSNLRLFLIVAASFALQLAIHHVPTLQILFAIEPIGLEQCLGWIGAGFLPLIVLELRKVILRRNAAP